MGIVHHANHIIFFETGRSHYARERGTPYSDFEKAGLYLTVAEIHARYARPALYDELITVRCWIVELKSRSVTFGYEIINAETKGILVTGESKHICIDKTGKVVPIPQAWRTWGET
jgi:acyl-CoA thioester hydrolase